MTDQQRKPNDHPPESYGEKSEESSKTTAVGWHDGMPMSEYLSLPFASSSRLSRLLRSPAHLKADLAHPPPSTSALAAGQAVHAAILEPDLFDKLYVMAPKVDRRTKAGKAAWAELEKQYAPGFVLTSNDYAMCLNMQDAAHNHPVVGPALRDKAKLVERVKVFDVKLPDGKSEIRAKMRADLFLPDEPLILDLKSTVNASRDGFEKSFRRYDYWIQEALYLLGMGFERNTKGQGSDFKFVAIEKSPPYGIGVYRSTPSDRLWALSQVVGLLQRYRNCMANDSWPGYTTRTQEFQLPSWYKDQVIDSNE